MDFDRAATRLAGAATFSKDVARFPQGYPVLIGGRGAYAMSDTGWYLDWVQGLGGAGVLGHAHPVVVEAVRERVGRGSALSLVSRLEHRVADLIGEMVPCAEMVRFFLHGGDATTAAVRVARHVTGREVIASYGYHGCDAEFVADTPPALGIPAGWAGWTVRFAWNDLAGLEQIFKQGPVAGVIFEVGLEEPEPGFLEGIRALCTEHGALMIWDEVVTGFRLALGGASEYYNVIPDLACFGKALGGGLPLAALAGRRELMEVFTTDEPVFMSRTHGGNLLSLAAAQAVLVYLRGREVIEHLWRVGEALKAGYNAAVHTVGLVGVTECRGQGPRSSFVFNDANGVPGHALRSLFWQQMIERGILVGVPNFPTWVHTIGEVDRTVEAALQALVVVKRAMEGGGVQGVLRGPVPAQLFTRYRSSTTPR